MLSVTYVEFSFDLIERGGNVRIQFSLILMNVIYASNRICVLVESRQKYGVLRNKSSLKLNYCAFLEQKM